MIHYADQAGNYLGAFDKLAEKPNGVMVSPPPHGKAIWNGESWDMSHVVRQQQEAARKAAYTAEADPLFFMSQRGEATVEEWQAKVAEIKARYPYPEETQA